jgi:hypothetical protein
MSLEKYSCFPSKNDSEMIQNFFQKLFRTYYAVKCRKYTCIMHPLFINNKVYNSPKYHKNFAMNRLEKEKKIKLKSKANKYNSINSVFF